MRLGKVLVFFPDGSSRETKIEDNEFQSLEVEVLPKLGELVKQVINSYRHTQLSVDDIVNVESLAYLDTTQLTFKFNIRDDISPVGSDAVLYTGRIELHLGLNEQGMEQYVLNVKTEGHVHKITILTLFVDNDFAKSLSRFMSFLKSYKFDISTL